MPKIITVYERTIYPISGAPYSDYYFTKSELPEDFDAETKKIELPEGFEMCEYEGGMLYAINVKYDEPYDIHYTSKNSFALFPCGPCTNGFIDELLRGTVIFVNEVK